jgi:hypothetical protein
MYLKSIFLLSIFSALPFFCSQVFSQELASNTVEISEKVIGELNNPQSPSKIIDWEPTTSLYLELGGKGFYSVNVDFRKAETKAMSIGIQYVESSFWPSLMFYHFGGERCRLEMGGGISGIITQEDGLTGMGIHGVVGYRYQKKKGLLFRAGFTPLIGIPFTDTGKFAIVPLVGVSLGYSF